jgi:hypothetical protein
LNQKLEVLMSKARIHWAWLAVVASLVATIPAYAQMHTQQQLPGDGFTCYKCQEHFLGTCVDTDVNELGWTACDDGSGECRFSGMRCARLPDIGLLHTTGVEMRLVSGEVVKALPISPGLWLSGDCETGLRTFESVTIAGKRSVALSELRASPVQVAIGY